MQTLTNNLTKKLTIFVSIVLLSTMLPLMAFTVQNNPHDPKQDIEWLIGTWEDTKGKGFFEKWELANDTIKGTRYQVKKNKQKVVQYMYITAEGHNLKFHTKLNNGKSQKTEVYDQKSNDGKTIVFTIPKGKYNLSYSIEKNDPNSYTRYLRLHTDDRQAVVKFDLKRVSQ